MKTHEKPCFFPCCDYSIPQCTFFQLFKSLRAVGAESAVIKDYNSLSVNTDVLDCDYYRFKELDAGAVNAFQNEYMSQYSWAEFWINE